MDLVLSKKIFVECPHMVAEDSPSLPKHARRDRDLMDKLALGEGLDGERAWQQGAFVRAWSMLVPGAKRQRAMTPKELNEDLMLRVLQAGQACFSQARHVSVALDGTRLGNKDVNLLAVGAFCGGSFRAMWAPVMALLGGSHFDRVVSGSWPGPRLVRRGRAQV